MGKFLKKNWFVLLAVIIFGSMSSYYIYDTNKGKLKGKSTNGEDVVFSVNDQDTTASAFYDALYKQYGNSDIVTLFKRTVAVAAVETTNQIKDTAATQAKSIESNYESQYGTTYQDQLKKDLASTGYTDLQAYLIDAQKINQITADYAKANFDDLKIRSISYILIKYTDSANPTSEPTEDEKARMKAVDDAFASGSDFATVATKYSEDASSAPNGGKLGVIDKNASNLDSAFLEAALALQEGETTDWVKSSQFGYFKIMCTAATQPTLEATNTSTNPYVELVQSYDTTLENKAIYQKATELGIDYKGNTDLENTIKTALGITESEGN